MFLFEDVDLVVVREKALLVAVGQKREKFLFIQSGSAFKSKVRSGTVACTVPALKSNVARPSLLEIKAGDVAVG
jgi:hypothetical protein